MPFYDAIRIGSSAVSDTAFTVDRSLRFNDGDSAYLSRTPSSTSNRRTWTFSAWVKRSNITTGAFQTLFAANDSSNYGLYGTYIWFTTTDTLAISINSGIYYLQTNAVFRDASAWYHVVVNIDTTDPTSSNRMKIYVNGVQETSFASSTYPTQNLDSSINLNQQHTIGGRRYTSIDNYFDGYMAEVNFIDGFQYDPSYFGETNAITGQWIPKKYTGSYGTNGFYLNFSDNSGTTATTLGKDSSGNGNNWTPNNFVTGDAVKDTPTNNFCTLNPVGNNSGGSLSNGCLQRDVTASVSSKVEGTFAVSSGKWYWEVNVISGSGNFAMIGIKDISIDGHENDFWNNNSVYAYYGASGEKYNSGSNTTYGATYTNGDIIGVALDLDAGTLIFYKNNATQGTAFSSLTGTYNAYVGTGLNAFVCVFNFGQDSTFAGNETAQGNTDGSGQGDFYYAPPSGYKALCSANLTDPTILLPDRHFDTFTYSGDGNSTQTLSNKLEFQPDWVWLKGSNTNYSHTLYDSRRGAGSLKGLNSNETRPEGSTVQDDSQFGYLSSFDANGITVTKGSDSTSYTNGASSEYVAWNWLAGGADSKTYKVKVVADSTDYGHGTGSNKYQFFKSDGTTGFGTNAVDLDLEEGGTYVFDWSDSSAQSHPLRFSLTNDGTHSNGTSAGTEYTTGVTKDDSAYKTTITIASGVANLFYYCQNHSGMGAEINTNTTKGSTNFDGSIQTTVKANTTAGFSIVTYTSPNNSSDQTVGHGLGVKPSFIIVKNRDATFNWDIYHSSLGYNASLIFTTASTRSGAFGAEPTSTVYTTKNNYTHASTNKYVAYVFSDVSSFSKIGSYVGNGNSDGPFVFTNFRPSFILTKRSDGTTPWRLFDNKRPNANFQTYKLEADSSGTELTGYPYADFLGNGFKIRDNGSYQNANGGNYVYLCFAESPFKNARAR